MRQLKDLLKNTSKKMSQAIPPSSLLDDIEGVWDSSDDDASEAKAAADLAFMPTQMVQIRALLQDMSKDKQPTAPSSRHRKNKSPCSMEDRIDDVAAACLGIACIVPIIWYLGSLSWSFADADGLASALLFPWSLLLVVLLPELPKPAATSFLGGFR